MVSVECTLALACLSCLYSFWDEQWYYEWVNSNIKFFSRWQHIQCIPQEWLISSLVCGDIQLIEKTISLSTSIYCIYVLQSARTGHSWQSLQRIEEGESFGFYLCPSAWKESLLIWTGRRERKEERLSKRERSTRYQQSLKANRTLKWMGRINYLFQEQLIPEIPFFSTISLSATLTCTTVRKWINNQTVVLVIRFALS